MRREITRRGFAGCAACPGQFIGAAGRGKIRAHIPPPKFAVLWAPSGVRRRGLSCSCLPLLSATNKIARRQAIIYLQPAVRALRKIFRFPRGYQPAEVVTQQGQRFSGIIKNKDNFSLQLLDNHDQLRLFVRSDLREIHYGKSSLMPAHYDKTLTPAELQDMLAFLSRQAHDKTWHAQESGEGTR